MIKNNWKNINNTIWKQYCDSHYSLIKEIDKKNYIILEPDFYHPQKSEYSACIYKIKFYLEPEFDEIIENINLPIFQESQIESAKKYVDSILFKICNLNAFI